MTLFNNSRDNFVWDCVIWLMYYCCPPVDAMISSHEAHPRQLLHLCQSLLSCLSCCPTWGCCMVVLYSSYTVIHDDKAAGCRLCCLVSFSHVQCRATGCTASKQYINKDIVSATCAEPAVRHYQPVQVHKEPLLLLVKSQKEGTQLRLPFRLSTAFIHPLSMPCLRCAWHDAVCWHRQAKTGV